MATIAVTIDCADPARLAEFWAQLLGYRHLGAVAQYASIVPSSGGDGPKLIFQRVDEPKSVKNRVHLDIDLEPGDPLDATVARALALGAGEVPDGAVSEFGMAWRVMTDPEGNEFCIVSRPA